MIDLDHDNALAELRWLALAVSQDSTRHSISKVVVDERGCAVATDGHRMHIVEGSCLPAGFTVAWEELEVIFALVKVYPNRTFTVDGKVARWKFGSASGGTCKLETPIDPEGFPEWRRVLPREGEWSEVLAKDLRKETARCNEEGMRASYCSVGQVYFNARYIDEALRGAPKRVRVQAPEDDMGPALIQYDNRLAVVMPIRRPPEAFLERKASNGA